MSSRCPAKFWEIQKALPVCRCADGGQWAEHREKSRAWREGESRGAEPEGLCAAHEAPGLDPRRVQKLWEGLEQTVGMTRFASRKMSLAELPKGQELAWRSVRRFQR